MEFHKEICDSKIYWTVYDPGSQLGIYVNKVKIDVRQHIRLNDGDVISVGGNFTAERVKTSKIKPYVFKIVAPEEWSSQQHDETNDEDRKIFYC